MTDREASNEPHRDVARRLARLVALEAPTSSLRHDLRGILSAAMLNSDRLITHSDPKVVRAGPWCTDQGCGRTDPYPFRGQVMRT